MSPSYKRTGGVRETEGNNMNFKSRGVRGALLAITVALAVSAVPAASGAADAAPKAPNKAILKAIL